ncbi:WD40-repeat-containing domain protein [Aspergillus karnatakaensis]|uniref:WD40-repeat-containing domain protein n=1 Tax=Aspergillus karnatakaensis TaxID=1810916 RepID=UPI003CCDC6B1
MQILTVFSRLADKMNQQRILARLEHIEDAAFNSYANDGDRCLAGTRVEILNEIENWAKLPNEGPILWMRGRAGTGKSTVARTVASLFHKDELLAGSFFFKRNEGKRGKARLLFTTLDVHLANKTAKSTVADQMKPLILKAADGNPDISGRGLEDQFRNLILQSLKAYEGPAATAIIVIDALDECDRADDIDVILRLLPQVQDSTNLQLRFFLTSRPEQSIIQSFEDIKAKGIRCQELDLDETGHTAIKRDIALFFDQKLPEIRKKRGLSSAWPGDQNLQTLITMSVPLFIFAATVCRMFDDLQWHPEESLKEVLAHQCDGSDLDRTYLPIFDQILKNQTLAKEDKLIEEYRTVIGTIVTVEAPISAVSISRLTDIHLESVRLRLNSLRSVLRVLEEDNEPIELFHQSFADFLLHSSTSRKQRFWIEREQRHHKLTVKCLEIMRNGLRKGADISNEEPEDGDVLRYACSYWARHLIQSEDPMAGFGEGISFLKDHFLHWVEAMSRLGQVSKVLEIIHTLQDALQGKQHISAADFLKDSRRFILRNREIAEIDPSQLYSSALIFAPRHSRIKEVFNDIQPSWPLLPKVADTWGSKQQTFRAHSKPVKALAFSPNSRLLASGSEDATIKLWDATTRELRHELAGHSDDILSLAFCGDSKLASGSGDGTIKLWDPVRGKLLQTLGVEGGFQVHTIAYSQHGLIAGSHGGSVNLWDASSGQLKRELKGHRNHVISVAFSPDGCKIVSASMGDTVKVWNLADNDTVRDLEFPMLWLSGLASSQDGQLLASIAHASTIEIRDWAGTLQHELVRCPDLLVSFGSSPPLTFSPDSRLLASTTSDSKPGLWNAKTGELLSTLEGHSDEVHAIVFSADGCFLASGDGEGKINIWDTSSTALQRGLEGESGHHTDSVVAIAFTPDGKLLASGSADNTIKLWDPFEGEAQNTLTNQAGNIQSLSFSPNGHLLASGSTDKTIKVWDLITHQEPKVLIGHSEGIRCVAFCPNQHLLASSSDDNTIRIWSPSTGSLQYVIKGSPSPGITSIAFSPDGDRLAFGNILGNIEIWHVTDRSMWTPSSWGRARLVENQSLLSSPDGRCSSFSHFGREIQTLSFSPDGRHLSSSRCDGITNTWDARNGLLQRTFNEYSHRIWTGKSTRISVFDGKWLCVNEERRLWLPWEYRPTCLAVSNSGILALGHISGRVSFMSVDGLLAI